MSRLFAEALGWDGPAWLAEAADAGPGLRGRERGSPCRSGGTRGWSSARHLHRRPAAPPRAGERRSASTRERYPHGRARRDRPARRRPVLLPDEPYVFTADDGPEAFAGSGPGLVSGRLLTWYGPSLLGGHLRSPDGPWTRSGTVLRQAGCRRLTGPGGRPCAARTCVPPAFPVAVASARSLSSPRPPRSPARTGRRAEAPLA